MMSDLDDSLCSQSSRRRSWFDGDNQKTFHFAVDTADDRKDVPNSPDDEEETLWLRHFTRPPRVDFGSVRVGATQSRRLLVANPLDHVQLVTLDRLPTAAGFSLHPERLSVDPGDSVSLTLTWTPEKEGNCRQLVLLLVDSVYRLQVVLLGTAVCPARTKNGGSRKTKRPFAVIQPVVNPPSIPGEGHKKVAAVRVNRSLDRPHKMQKGPKYSKRGSEERENRTVSSRTITSLAAHSVTKSKSPAADLFNCKPALLLSEADFPETPTKRATFIKDDPALPVTPVRRMTYKKITAVMCNAPVVSPRVMAAVAETSEVRESATPVGKEQMAVQCDTAHPQPTENLNDPPVIIQTIDRMPSATCRPVLTSSGSDDAPLMMLSKVEEQLATDVSIAYETPTSVVRDASRDCKNATSASTTYYLDQAAEDSFNRCDLSEPRPGDPAALQHRLSSTPLVSTADSLPRFKSKVADRTPSPIIGQRVARGTVVKKLAPVPADILPSWAVGKNLTMSPDTPSSECAAITKGIVVRAGSELRPTCKQLFRSRPSPPPPPRSVPPTKRRSSARIPAQRSPTKRLSIGKMTKFKTMGAASESTTRTRSIRAREAQKHKTTNDISKMPHKKAAPKIAQSRLVLISKPSKTAIPKHAMPFAAKNVYYDERWMEKEERAFVRWLNFVLTPPDELLVDAKKPQKVDARSIFLGGEQSAPRLAPDKETLSFRSYATRRRLNRLRRAACAMFQSEPVVVVIQRLEREIENRRLLVRPDRMIHADVGIKQNILNMLLSYNPLWLRIGLETVYGEMLAVQSNTDVIGLSHFILTRLLANPDIAEQYAHPTVPHLFHQGYDVAMAQFTLKKFLLLVLLLDRAKASRLINHDPCLFCKDAEIKSSREMLLWFSREHLCGEGDLTRHLNHLGYSVKHEQLPTEEYDYAVKNLATDLRDGIRLTRVIELQTADYTLSKQLRAPAISKLQKVHNMGVVFKALTDRGVDVHTFKDGRVDPRDIVVGHRQKTLHVMWNIIFKFQVELVLSESQLRDEIRFLRQTNSVNSSLQPATLTNLGLPRKHRRQSSEADIYFKSPRLSLLLKWCQAVCAPYRVKIDNLTVSFADGRALCYLVHRYHPELVPRGAIRDRTSLTYQGELNMSVSSGDDSFSGSLTQAFSPVCKKSPLYEELLANEKANFKLLFEKVSELGGIPMMLCSGDMSNTIPDEKVVITYVTYLCARLLDIRQEVRAARVIQTAWRRHQLKSKQQMAVVVIQRAVRGFLQRRRYSCTITTRNTIVENKRRHQSACIIQAAARRFLARRRMHDHHHRLATLQSIISDVDPSRTPSRGDELDDAVFLTTSGDDAANFAASTDELPRQPESCSTADSSFQDCVESLDELCPVSGSREEDVALSCFKDTCSAVQGSNVVESLIHTSVGSAAERISCVNMSISASAVVNEHNPRNEQQVGLITNDNAKVHGSFTYRGTSSSSSGNSVMDRSISAEACVQAALKLQSLWRMALEKRRYARRRRSAQLVPFSNSLNVSTEQQHAAVTLQRRWRATRVMKGDFAAFHVMRGAAITLQAWWRGVLQRRRRYLQERKAAVCIQAWWRSAYERRRYLKTRRCVLTVQSWWRDALRLDSLRRHAAALVIQTCYRRCKEMCAYVRVKTACVLIQRWFRAQCEHREYHAKRRATLTIQSWWRSIIEARSQQQKYSKMRRSTSIIQSWWRNSVLARSQREKYLNVRAAALMIQTCYRKWQAMRTYACMRNACIVIQRRFRATCQARCMQSEFCMKQKSVLAIQHWWRSTCRARSDRQQYVYRQHASIAIQTWWRSFCESRYQRQQYLQTRHATIDIQTWWRSICQSRCQRQKYLLKRQATFVIQTWWRSLYESRCQRQQYLQTRQATIDIQTWWRSICQSRCQRQKYIQKRQATFVIKTWWRSLCESHCQRQKYLQTRQATVDIQTWWRSICESRCQRRQYLQKRQATIDIQNWWRSLCESRLQRQKYLQKKQATFIIQTWWLSLGESRQMQQYLQTRQATVYIQTWWRSLCESRCQRQQYLQTRQATIVLQTWWRSLCKSRYQRQQYLQTRQATIDIQTWWRSLFESRCQRQQFLRRRQATNVIQTWWRLLCESRCQRQKYLQTRQATIIIQTWWRSLCESRCQRQHYLQMRQATIVLQTWWRFTHQFRCQWQYYQSLQWACVKIQSAYRGKRARQCLQRHQEAASRIQTAYHVWKLRLETSRQNAAALMIQTSYRSWKLRQSFLSQRSACVVIQRYFREFVARRELQRKRTAAAIILQTFFRRLFDARNTRRRYLRTRQLIIRLQSACRGWLLRRQVMRERCRCEAAVCIQRCFRGYRTRRQLEVARLLNRERIVVALRAQLAVITIQRAFRQHRALQVAKDQLGHVVRLQRWMRSRLYRLRFLKLRRGIRLIQAIARQQIEARNMAAVKIQASVRSWLTRKRENKRERAAVVLQACWRAHAVRRNVKSKKLRLACERAQQATKNASAQPTLGQRTSSALDYLLRYKQLSYIRDAVINLDVVSRLSPLCCERIVEWNAVSVLFRLIRSCNRSLPHMEIISYTVNILLNLAKYEKTVAAVYEGENSVDVLVDLVTIYREKGAIFPKTCVLIGLLASDPLRQVEMSRHPHLLDKLHSCLRLTARRHQQRERPTRAAVAASSRSFNVSALMSFSETSVLVTPRRRAIQPDWQLGSPDGYMVDDPLLAVRFALSCLEGSSPH